MAYAIRFTKGPQAGTVVPVSSETILIGRSSECARSGIRLVSEYASRRHVAIEFTPQGAILTNLSSHRTVVGDTSVPEKNRIALPMDVPVKLCPVKHEIEFVLQYVYEGDAPTDNPSALAGQTVDVAVSAGATESTFPATALATPTAATAALPTGTVDAGALRTAGFDAKTSATIGTNSLPTKTIGALETGATRADTFTGNGNADPPSGGTLPGGTILASPEEINRLLDYSRKKNQRRSFKKAAIWFLVFLGVAALYNFVSPNPESTLTHPVDASGKRDVRRIPLEAMFGKQSIFLDVPNDSGMKISNSSNGTVRVTTRLGRNRDVPYYIFFSVVKNPEFARSTRDMLFKEHISQLESTGSWNFQAKSPLGYIGKDNGLPFLEIQYSRSVKVNADVEQRFGYLLFAVYGDCEFILTREVPDIEQWRAGRFLAGNRHLSISQKMLDRRWEGRSDYRDDPVDHMLAEATALLANKTPLLWKDVEYILQCALIKTAAGGDAHDRALSILQMLRERERTEFSRLKISWEKHRRLGDKKACKEDMLEALGIFSSAEDRRNMLLKKGVWQ